MSLKLLGQIIVAVLLVATIAGAVAILLRQASLGPVEITLSAATPTTEMSVYVSGAVAQPGVYTLRPGDRLQQALEAAGGPLPQADLDRVNLALRVRDQDHFYIPRQGETATPAPPVLSPVQARINVNTASAEELLRLPNIGETRAQAIVSYRESRGPFRTAEDLLKVPGIGPTILSAIRDLITVE
ncbi:MAG: helix-hairpin-helix domain-containing protein [Chloroflexi bacterium]|nr:helix-hairpin-helix domain-containing protein [Chloroflexota bacterium]